MLQSIRCSAIPELSVYATVEEPEGHPVNSYLEPVQANSHSCCCISCFNIMLFSHI